jgi:hypothetical protein
MRKGMTPRWAGWAERPGTGAEQSLLDRVNTGLPRDFGPELRTEEFGLKEIDFRIDSRVLSSKIQRFKYF